MEIRAGTSQGVFVVSEGAAKQVLRSSEVRELVRIGGRCFAGTGDGLHVSDDCGRTWMPSGLEGRQVWQVRDDGTDTGEAWRVSDGAEWELCGEGMPTVLSLAATS